MKYTIDNKAEYVTKIFTILDENENEYFVRFMEDLSYTAVEVESDEDGLLGEDDPRYKELVTLCEEK
jgi:hypothetical protein